MIADIRNQFGLTDRDIKTINSIFAQYPEVEEAKLFGSRAKGNHSFGSDIDLAIINEGVSLKTVSRLAADFEESTLPYKVDIVNLPSLKHEELAEHVRRVGVAFYRK